MKFVIPTQELNFLINKCLNIVPPKPTLPILSNLLIETSNNELRITASDLTVGIRCYTEAKIIEEGAIAIPAKKFAPLIKELTSMNVEIQSGSNGIMEIISNSSRFKLLGMNPSEFPSLPMMTGATQIKMLEADFREILSRTAFAVSREDNRYVLTGILMRIDNGEATFVGTDGKKLARSQIPLKVDGHFKKDYILPLKAVDEMLKNLQGNGEATLMLLPDKIAIETSHSTLITKLLSGEYPDVSRIIPSQTKTNVSLHREELMSLLRQVALFTDEKNHSVKFAFTDGELRLTANTMDIGEGHVSMPVNYAGQKLEIAFNPNYFIDILRHSHTETVNMAMTDPYNPGIITDMLSKEAHSAARSLFVIMPMRLVEE